MKIHADKPSCFFEVSDIRYPAWTDMDTEGSVIFRQAASIHHEGRHRTEIKLPTLPSPLWKVSVAKQRQAGRELILNVELTAQDGAFSMVVIQPVITGILYGDCTVSINTDAYSKVRPDK